jgi:uncharacterized cupredoxin-like copper-binding protein
MPRSKLPLIGAFIAAMLLSACSGSPAGGQVNPDGSINVVVKLNDFTIKSSVTEFKPGVPYHFMVSNEGQVGHEFMILPVSDELTMLGTSGMSMQDLDQMALMMIPIEELSPGASVKADYTFASVPPGKLELVCLTQGHYQAGMHIPITVK